MISQVTPPGVLEEAIGLGLKRREISGLVVPAGDEEDPGDK